MTIHAEHPFRDPDEDPVKRLRGRLGGRVGLLTSGTGPDRAGLTVSSLMVAAGEPAYVLALVDPDSDLAECVEETGTAVLQLLDWRHRDLAEVFAGLAPSPGGPFVAGTWRQSDWGPVLDDAPAWAALAVDPSDGLADEVGWSVLLRGRVVSVTIADSDETPLHHRRGRYVRPPA